MYLWLSASQQSLELRVLLLHYVHTYVSLRSGCECISFSICVALCVSLSTYICIRIFYMRLSSLHLSDYANT